MTKIKRTNKLRKHSGRTEGKSTLKIPKQQIINNCLEPRTFWDDWIDYRDGMRDYYDNSKKKSIALIKQLFNWDKDRAREAKKVNDKLMKKEKIRRARK